MANTPSSDMMARVVRWAVLLFLGYALLHGFFDFGSKAPTVRHGAAGDQAKSQEKECDTVNPLKNFSSAALPLLPSYLPALRIQDITPGDGAPAMCGQDATLRYEYTLASGEVIFSNFKSGKEPQPVRLGSSALLHGLERGVIGMKPGGERRMTIPPDLAFAAVTDIRALRDASAFSLPRGQDIRDLPVTARVSLIAAAPPPPASDLGLRAITTRLGYGALVQCGSIVEADITVWKLNGARIFSTPDHEPVRFVVGMGTLPLGIEQGVIGMQEGSQRTVIMPVDYATPFNAADEEDTGASDEEASPGEHASDSPASSGGPGGKTSVAGLKALPRQEILLADIAIVQISAPGKAQPAPRAGTPLGRGHSAPPRADTPAVNSPRE